MEEHVLTYGILLVALNLRLFTALGKTSAGGGVGAGDDQRSLPEIPH